MKKIEYALRCRNCNKGYKRTFDPDEKPDFCSGSCRSAWEHKEYYRNLRNTEIKREVKREVKDITRKYSDI